MAEADGVRLLEEVVHLWERELPGDPELPMVTDHSIELRPCHSVAGNPMRFRTGLTELRADEAWRTAMSTRDRRVVTAIAWPLLRRFGYRGASPR